MTQTDDLFESSLAQLLHKPSEENLLAGAPPMEMLFTVAFGLRVSGELAVKSTHAQSKRKMILGLHADEERSSQETQKSSQISWTTAHLSGVSSKLFGSLCLTEIITRRNSQEVHRGNGHENWVSKNLPGFYMKYIFVF